MTASRTGAATDRDIKFSGFSSQRGVPGREPSLDPGPGDTGVFGGPLGVSVRVEGTTLSREELVYTGIEAEEGVTGRLLPSRDTAESVEDRRALVDLASSLAWLSELSGTLPLLPELVSSDRPLSTPSILL